MKYRKLTSEGDYSFGASGLNFYTDIQAIAQAIQTRLQLFQGDFWRDQEAGLPLMQKIAGTPGSPQNLTTIDAIILQLVKETEGVTEIIEYSSDFDGNTRSYSFQGLVQTIYSETIPFVGTLGT